MNKPLFDSLPQLIELLDKDVSVSYGVYGDGELICAMEHPLTSRGKNGQGECYTLELRQALVSVLDEGLLSAYGLFPGKKINEEGEAWLVEHGYDHLPRVSNPHIRLGVHSGNGAEFIACLENKDIIIVGPKHLHSLDFFSFRHVVCQLPNAFYSYDAVEEELIAQIKRKKPDVVLVSMGMPAAVLISNTIKKFGRVCSLLDCGSIWDGYVGVYSRGKMGKPRHLRLMSETRNELERLFKERNGV